MATDRLQAALGEYFAKPMKLNIVLGKVEVATPAVVEQQAKQFKQQLASIRLRRIILCARRKQNSGATLNVDRLNQYSNCSGGRANDEGRIRRIDEAGQQMQQNVQKARLIGDRGSGGAGGFRMVKVTMTCGMKCVRVSLDDSVLSDDKDMLEDLIVLALTMR